MGNPGLSLVLVIGLAAVSSDCGGNSGGGGTASCTISQPPLADGGASIKQCEEVSGSAQWLQTLHQGCLADGNSFADAGVALRTDFESVACPRAGVVGGCRETGTGVTETVWYYDDGSGVVTVADVQTTCASLGTTFVSP